MYGFFDRMPGDGSYVGEDVSFCRRWRFLGGEVFGLFGAEIGHVGTHVFR
jgi:hypothetical protein